MGILFLAHFCPIRMKYTSSGDHQLQVKHIKSGFWPRLGDLPKLGPNMGVAAPRTTVGCPADYGGRSESGTPPKVGSLVLVCWLYNKRTNTRSQVPFDREI